MTNEISPKKTERLPMIPIRDVVVFPHMMIPFVIGRPTSVRALEHRNLRWKAPNEYFRPHKWMHRLMSLRLQTSMRLAPLQISSRASNFPMGILRSSSRESSVSGLSAIRMILDSSSQTWNCWKNHRLRAHARIYWSSGCRPFSSSFQNSVIMWITMPS